MRANETYSEAKHQFSVRNIDVLMNVQSPHKWWSTLKSAVFGSSSSLSPLVGPGGGLVCESVEKADLLSDHFDRNLTVETFVRIVSRILMSNAFFSLEIIIYEVLLTFRESLSVINSYQFPVN